MDVLQNSSIGLTGIGFKATKDKLVECYQTAIKSPAKKEVFTSERYNSHNQFLESYRSLLGEALNEIYTEGDCDLIPRSDNIAASGFTYNVTFDVTAKLNELLTDLSAAEQ